MEADLGNPSLDKQFNLRPGPGLTDVLARDAGFAEAVQEVDLRSAVAPRAIQTSPDGSANGHAGGAPPTVEVLTGGGAERETSIFPARSIGSMVAQMAQTREVVVIDGPPILSVSGIVPLLSALDGVIIVGRVGSTDVASAHRVTEFLARVPDVRVLGVVANGSAEISIED